MPSTVEQIKSKLNIADIIGSYIKLEKAGGNFRAKCPFHNEKTPSFYVSPSRESFHCFGCDKGGDIISFVEEIEGLEFIDALKILADKAGVEINKNERQEKSEKGRFLSLMESATKFYEAELRKNPEPVNYLLNRGLTKDTIKNFRIGYAPNDWRRTSDYLKKVGYTEKEMEATGLIVRNPKGYYDKFRSRIMFPITNLSGSPVAFTGRMFEEKGKKSLAGENPAKYMNSPQTLLYDKSNILFGMDKAKVSMGQKDTCVVVEGQMDLIMSHQAGVTNTIAVSGTAFTENHLKKIMPLSNKIIWSYDGDSAGFNASARAMELALSYGMNVRLAILPEEKDPADLILKDPKKWTEAIENSVHIVDYLMNSIKKENLPHVELSTKISDVVAPFLVRIKNKMEQDGHIKNIAGYLEISEQSVRDTLNKIKTVDENINTGNNNSKNKIKHNFEEPASLTLNKKIFDIEKKIWSLLEWHRGSKKHQFGIDKKEKEFIDIIGKNNYEKIKEILFQKKNGLLLESEILYDGAEKLENEADNLLKILKENILKMQLQKEMYDLKISEKKGDKESIKEHLANCQRISKELNALKK